MSVNKETNYTLLADTAILAGEIMLTAGAETYRVEDTIRRILKTSGFERCDVFAVTTGIMITLADCRVDTISIIRRIGEKDTNLYNVYKVNEISRKYCEGNMSVEEASYELKNLNQSVYPKWITRICMLLATSGFTLLLGGDAIECLISAINGFYILFGRIVGRRLRINTFITTMSISFCIAFNSMVFKDILFYNINLEVLIAGSNMALLPGVAITNAIRDTLQGDYTSGGTRAIEAFVIAMSIGVGIGMGLAFCTSVLGVLV